jgi:5-methyltetrahydrofolate--homocysteine methyltransferase
MKDRIVLKDGSVGNTLSNTDAGKRVPVFEILNLEAPETVLDLHLQYIDAGADLITTNSFSADPYSLREWNLEDKAYEINLKGAQIAQKAVDQSGKDLLVLGSIGPTPASLTLRKGKADFTSLKESYKLQAKALMDGGADIIIIETIHDPLNAKAAWIAVLELIDEGYQTEIALSMTVESSGVSLAGQSIESFLVSVNHLNPIFVGLNCSLGPQSLYQPVLEMAEFSPFPISLAPNAGLPNELGQFTLTPELFAEQLIPLLEKSKLNIIGGCCGTTPAHINHLAGILNKYKPRNETKDISRKIAGLDAVHLAQKPSPLVVGERANTLGSKKFKKHVEAKEIDNIIDVLRTQSLSGAHALDICFASIEQDEESLWREFAPQFAGSIHQPVFIDTTNNDVIKTALEFLPGKPVINSVNLEDKGERIKSLLPLRRYHPFALIVGLIDEYGMAKTLDHKLDVSRKAYDLLTSNNVDPSDIIFDPLVFPLSSDIHPYTSIKAMRIIQKKYPKSSTILGISNISFGLPPVTRQILNSIYLDLALDAGLDIAILNVTDLARQASISPDDRALALRILRDFDKKALSELIEKYRDTKIETRYEHFQNLPLPDRIREKIACGIKDGLDNDIAELLKTTKAIDIINHTLMSGMDRVGELFGSGKMIISEVLLSAEVFKQAMKQLTLELKKESIPKAGKIILATVKGDVHDIGRNLVGMILESHGFEIIDLGTKVPPEDLVNAIRRENPDAVGLSGLLIRSAYMMKETVETFSRAGIKIPVVVGGAALTEQFTIKEIAPAYTTGTVKYASNALDALKIFRKIMGSDIKQPAPMIQKPKKYAMKRVSRTKIMNFAIPSCPDLDHHVSHPSIDDLSPFINWKMLIHKFMGAKLEKKGVVRSEIEVILDEAANQNIFKPVSIFRYFHAKSEGDDLIALSPDSKELFRIRFTRSDDRICASDWIAKKTDKNDSIAIFVVTSGNVSSKTGEFRKNNELFKAFAIEALSLSIAEANAEYTHNMIRELWGITDRSRGVRLSPGYPCCPDLSIQKTIFDNLNPEAEGISLTDEFMMQPEASISAIVFHNPNGRLY